MHTNRTRTSKLLLSATTVVGLTLVATGCGKSPSEFVAEKVIEQQTDGDVDVDFDSGEINIDTPDGNVTMNDDGSFSVTDENGETVVGQADDDGNFTVEGDDGSFSVSQDGEIPEEWPSDIPQPDGLTVSSSSVIDTGDGDGITIAGTVDDAEGFMSEYGATLEGAGLTKGSEFSTADAMSAMYANESWTISIGSSEYDGEQQVSITLYPFSG